MVKYPPVSGTIPKIGRRTIRFRGDKRGLRDRGQKKASLSRVGVKKTRTAKSLSTSTFASQSLQVCSMCMKGLDQYQTTRDFAIEKDVSSQVSSDIVTTSTSMP